MEFNFVNSLFFILFFVLVDSSVKAQVVEDNAIKSLVLENLNLTDPSVAKINNVYYIISVANENTEIHIYQSPYLTNFCSYSEQQIVYKSPVGYGGIKSPKLYQINGKLVISFIMKEDSTSLDKIYTMTANIYQTTKGQWKAPMSVSDNPLGSFTDIQNSVILHQNHRLFLMWTARSSSSNRTAVHISSISSIDEGVGPVISLLNFSFCNQAMCTVVQSGVMYNNNKAFLFFTRANELIYLSISLDDYPMEGSSWKQGQTMVLHRAILQPSFTTSADDTETWMMFQENDMKTRLAKLEWEATGNPAMHMFMKDDNNSRLWPSGEPEMFTNPILDENYYDPKGIFMDGIYYLSFSVNQFKTIVILKSDSIANFRQAEKKTVYQAPQGCHSIFSCRLHRINDQLYKYFSMKCSNTSYQLYVIQADNPQNALGGWGKAVFLDTNNNNTRFSVHPAVLQQNENVYLLWSSPHPTHDSIYIRPMNSPTEVNFDLPAVLLKTPRESWECLLSCRNKNPNILYTTGVTHLLFSASEERSLEESLGHVSIESGRDPMVVTNWTPALQIEFSSNPKENVYGAWLPGFISTPNPNEFWMVYEGKEVSSGEKTVRAEKITVNQLTGALTFPKAHGFEHPQPVTNTKKMVNTNCL